MPTVLKLFLTVLTVLVFLYMVTNGAGMINHPSDMSVLFGVVLVFLAFVVLYYAVKYIWFKQITITNRKGK
jgi:hypothetical protein